MLEGFVPTGGLCAVLTSVTEGFLFCPSLLLLQRGGLTDEQNKDSLLKMCLYADTISVLIIKVMNLHSTKYCIYE